MKVQSNSIKPTVFNIGYNTKGGYKSTINKKKTKVYQTWQSMLERCYNEKSLIKCPTYIGCSVDERWHNFQVFAKWFENNYVENYALDKDILIKGNKIYSPETCCFVPQEINKLFIKSGKNRGKYLIGVYKDGCRFKVQISKGKSSQTYLGSFDTEIEAFKVYKESKENYIKELAYIWKEKIDCSIYNSLINYEVNIID